MTSQVHKVVTRLPRLPRHIAFIKGEKPPARRCFFTDISQCEQTCVALAVCGKFQRSAPRRLVLLHSTKQSATYLRADLSKVSLDLL